MIRDSCNGIHHTTKDSDVHRLTSQAGGHAKGVADLPPPGLTPLCDRRVWPSSSGRGRLHRPCARTRRC